MKYLIKYLIRYIYYKLNIFTDFRAFNSFPFDPNHALSSKGVDLLIRGCEIVESTGANYRLTDGTVLGIYRDGKLIDHDNDIDIDVLINNQLEINSIIEGFKRNNFKIGRIVYYKNVIQQIVFFDANQDLFDILFWTVENEKILNYSEENFVREQNIENFLNLETILFENKQYPIPSDIINWLESRYGVDWRIPKTYKGDWKDDCHDLIKI
jgi:phosphorylcholine metabolism protein LicD